MTIDLNAELATSRNNINTFTTSKPSAAIIAPTIPTTINNTSFAPVNEVPDHFTTEYIASIIARIPEAPTSIIKPDFNAYTIGGEAYTRATRVIDHRVTSDDFKHVNLKEWKEDCMLTGFFSTPSLIDAYTNATTSKNRREVKNQARILGGGEDGLNYGTLIHSIMESWVAHQDKLAVFHKVLPGYLFSALLENIDLFNAHKLKVVSSENIMIISENLKIAGTFDSIVKDANDQYFIHDYKSTKTSSLPLSLPSYELQMYAYAQSKFMITKSGEKKPIPKEINQDYGFITHTPIDGPAQMIKVDYSYAKKEFPIVLESFAAQIARDQAIKDINKDRTPGINFL